MARKLIDIINQMKAAKLAEQDLDDLNNPSQTSIWNLWIYIQALQSLFNDQLNDFKKAEIETIVASAIVPSEPWLQRKVFEFQYSPTAPQFIQLINFVPSYPIIDPTLRIVTRCSVKTTGQRIVNVKVAKNDPPEPLSGSELTSLNGYLTQGGDGTIAGSGVGVSYAGVQINVVSIDPDRLYLKGNIFYNGQFASTIYQLVTGAINAYLASIPFDGNVKVLDLVDAIQSVGDGVVTDIKIEDVAMRASSMAFTSKIFLIQNFTQALTVYPTYAGYIIEEDSAGQTFADQLTFTAS